MADQSDLNDQVVGRIVNHRTGKTTHVIILEEPLWKFKINQNNQVHKAILIAYPGKLKAINGLTSSRSNGTYVSPKGT